MSEIKNKRSFFGRLQERIDEVLFARPEVDEETMEDLEEILIMADIGLDTTEKILDTLANDIKTKFLWQPEAVRDRIKDIVKELIDKEDQGQLISDLPLIILAIGVNGSGKTTTIAKLAHRLQNEGKSVLLAAGDTFRAAAAEQLSLWGDRLGIGVIKHQEGSDPSAVIYDAIQAAKARNIDVLICDTAGRLQTKKNLMDELAKMYRIIEREYPEAAIESLLVIDANTGKNAISQAEEFTKAGNVTGIVLTKLDGTAKGGIVVTIADLFEIPVKFIGVGEKSEDLIPFDGKAFAEAIFS